MSIRELTWQIKQVVLEAQNFTSILPSLRIFSLKTYEISDLGQNSNKNWELTQLFHSESSQSFMTSFVTSFMTPLVT